MLFILKEKHAKHIFESYRNVAAFTMNNTKGYTDGADLTVSYGKLSLIPDDDTINGVINGDIKAKSVIKAAMKQLRNPGTKSQDICLNMTTMLGIMYPNKIPNNGPNVLVFVFDDNEADDPKLKARQKFLTKYLTELFGVFGIEPITDPKIVSETFKCKNPEKKKSRRKVIERVCKLAKKKKYRLSKNGYAIRQMMAEFYSLELRQQSLTSVPDLTELGKKSVEILAKALKRVYTNDNLEGIENIGFADEYETHMMKLLRKKNRKTCKYYHSFASMMAEAMPDMKLPKVKSGYTKKGKKSGNDKPLMNVKKFMKFYSKKKNLPIMAMLYAHSICCLLDVEIGSKEYNKTLSKVAERAGIADIGKAYIAAAKKQVEAKPAE